MKLEPTINKEEMVKLHFPVIAPLLMDHGVGDGKTTACVMAQAATIWHLSQGLPIDKPTDELECCCPILRRLAIRANDTQWWASKEERTEHLRPLIPLLLNSSVNKDAMLKRTYKVFDQAVRIICPMRIEFRAQFRPKEIQEKMMGWAKTLREIPAIKDKESTKVARDICYEVRADALAASDAAAAAYSDAAAVAYAAAYAYAYADAATYAAAAAAAYTAAAAYSAADTVAASDAAAAPYTALYTAAAADTVAANTQKATEKKIQYRTMFIQLIRDVAAIKD